MVRFDPGGVPEDSRAVADPRKGPAARPTPEGSDSLPAALWDPSGVGGLKTTQTTWVYAGNTYCIIGNDDMPLSKNAAQKEDRLSIRANPGQKGLLAQAARARHMNVSQFVLQASIREAERVVREETTILVSPEEYAWLVQTLDEAAPAPRLREALAQKPAWDA